MSPASPPEPSDAQASRKPRGIHPGWVLAGFFTILMAFNISFLVIAVQHPPKLVPKTSPSEVTPSLDRAPSGAQDAPSR